MIQKLKGCVFLLEFDIVVYFFNMIHIEIKTYLINLQKGLILGVFRFMLLSKLRLKHYTQTDQHIYPCSYLLKLS